MADASNFGPPGGPLSGGMEAQQSFANNYDSAAQEKQAAIQELAKQLPPEPSGPERGLEPER
jgi:hypothetical protein